MFPEIRIFSILDVFMLFSAAPPPINSYVYLPKYAQLPALSIVAGQHFYPLALDRGGYCSSHVHIFHKTICLSSNSMSAEGLLFQTCKNIFFVFFSALIIKCCIILFDLVVNPPCQNHRLPQPFQRPISLINICHSTDI